MTLEIKENPTDRRVGFCLERNLNWRINSILLAGPPWRAISVFNLILSPTPAELIHLCQDVNELFTHPTYRNIGAEKKMGQGVFHLNQVSTYS